MCTRVPCVSQQRCRLSLLLQSTLLGARGASECTACRCRWAHRQAPLLFEQRSRCGLAVSGITPPSSGQTTAGKVVPSCEHRARRCLPLMSNVRRHQYHRAMQQGHTSIAAPVVRVACLAALLRRAACPLAVGAPIVLRKVAGARIVPGRPSVGGRRTVVHVLRESTAPRRLERTQRQSGSCAVSAPLGSGGACVAAQQVRSAYAAMVLRQGRHRRAVHAGGCVVGVGSSRAEGGAVPLRRQHASTIVLEAPPNPSIERTCSGTLRVPTHAAHVER
jgi:hypothetical protein